MQMYSSRWGKKIKTTISAIFKATHLCETSLLISSFSLTYYHMKNNQEFIFKQLQPVLLCYILYISEIV